MKAVLEVKTVSQNWAPPFAKRSETAEIEVDEGESLDKIDDERGFVFTILKIQSDRVLVQYNRAYTLKGYSQPATRQTWIDKQHFTEFSFLWGNNGTTKSLRLKEAISGPAAHRNENPHATPAEPKTETAVQPVQNHEMMTTQ